MVNSTANQLPTDVQFEKQLGQLTTWVRLMRQAGLPIEKALQMPIDDPDMRKRLVRFWNSGGYEPTVPHKRAREIMGKNFFGIEEAMKHFSVNPSMAQLTTLADIPFNITTIESCRGTHVLVAVFPLSLLDVHSKVNSELFCDQPWYNNESFAKDHGDVSWKLVRKTPVEDSTNKTCDEQQALLAKNEGMSTIRVMVYTIIGHFLATGERLFERTYVRCSDVDSDGVRGSVGKFGVDGLSIISHCWDDYRNYCVGIASTRKSD